MKKLILLTFLVGFTCRTVLGQTDPIITSWLQNSTTTGNYYKYVSGVSTYVTTTTLVNIQSVYYTTSTVYITGTGMPAYTVGPWTANPNLPSNQNLKRTLTRTPTALGTTRTGLGTIGLWKNGTAVYDPKDGQYWTGTAFTNGTSTTGWNRNALYYEGVSFDNCLGHPGPSGAYHNHVNPKCLYDATASTAHSPILGYANDGYPIYGPYAYTNTDGTGAIKRMVSSYVLSTASTRPTRGGVAGPTVNATYPLGCLCEDYTYTAGAGDLDEHNGRTCKTPEYPSSTYAYFITIDANGSPAFPFVIGTTFNGSIPASTTYTTIPANATLYTASTIPVELFGFTVQLEDKNSALIRWKVGVEDNVATYEIERSIDAQKFEQIDAVKAEQKRSYGISDKNLLRGGTYYYRLKTVDKDGSFKYSPTASLSIKNGQSLLVHNNPAQDVLVVQSDNALVERTIALFSLDGKMIQQKALEQGATMCAFDVQTLYAGTYIVRVSNGQDFKTVKVVIQN